MSGPAVVSIDRLPAIGPAAVTMGVFDGVHLGHRAMLTATREAAERRGIASVALVFDPPPDEVLRPGTRVPRVAPLATVLARIGGDCGIGHVIPLRFDDSLRSRSPEEFLDALAGGLALQALVMSPESAFGRGRSGTVSRMTELGAERGFEVVTVERVVVDGEPVTSSLLRALIGEGDVEGVSRRGYPPRLEGSVVEDDHRGSAIGYPTLSLAFDYLPALPAGGVYAARAGAPERGVAGQPALVSIGDRPTLDGRDGAGVEAHLLDFDAHLAGARLELDLVARLPDEPGLGQAEEAGARMQRHEAAARELLGLPRSARAPRA